MAVEVKVTSVLQRVIGAKTVQGEGKTVGELLDDMNVRYPGFKEQITMEDGSLHRFVNIYINDEDVRFLQQLETPVNDGDIVSILPALAGGAFAEPQAEPWGMGGAATRRDGASALSEQTPRVLITAPIGRTRTDLKVRPYEV
jgi:molybdopterin synthase sulfur carrier subunit